MAPCLGYPSSLHDCYAGMAVIYEWWNCKHLSTHPFAPQFRFLSISLLNPLSVSLLSGFHQVRVLAPKEPYAIRAHRSSVSLCSSRYEINVYANKMYSLNTTQQIEMGGGRILCQKVEKRKDDRLYCSLNSYPNEISQQCLFISVEMILQLCSSLNVLYLLFQKLKEFLEGRNLITKLQAKHELIQKTLGESE